MKKIILLNVGFIIIVTLVLYGVTSYTLDKRADETTVAIRLQIAEQEKTLVTISEITDQNGADAVVESIIVDCNLTKRDRFDTLLNSLGTLSPAELQETEGLFGECARFFAERKALMVARFEREVGVYENLVTLLSLIGKNVEVELYPTTQWNNLVTLEKKRSTLFNSLADIQYVIIRELQAGKKVGSVEIAQLLADAQNFKQEESVINQQIDELRKDLLDL